MTTLATYTFPSGSNLATGIAVRVYCAGRYLNNTGGALAPTITTTVNGAAQCSIAPSFNSSAIALGFRIEAQFYFTHSAVPAAGNNVSVGSNVRATFSNAQATATTTGTFVAGDYFQILSNPYNTFIVPSVQNTLAVNFNLAGADVLELHESHMEAL